MSRTYHNGERRLRVWGVRRKLAGLRRLARKRLDLTHAQTEAEAEAEYRTQQTNTMKARGTRKGKDHARQNRSEDE